jgi:hypothetical protein
VHSCELANDEGIAAIWCKLRLVLATGVVTAPSVSDADLGRRAPRICASCLPRSAALARGVEVALLAVAHGEQALRLGPAREIDTCPMPALCAASSLTYQPDVASGEGLFPAGMIVVTSLFGGGLYTLPRFRRHED